MTNEEAQRHASHLCDVFPADERDEHIGVIEELRHGDALIGGHPEYRARWIPVAQLATSCRIQD
jgi:hypothetical protein